MSDTTIQAVKNGPLLVKGQVQVLDAQGKQVPVQGESVALCRCGQSSNKPFCDGTHRKVSFQG